MKRNLHPAAKEAFDRTNMIARVLERNVTQQYKKQAHLLADLIDELAQDPKVAERIHEILNPKIAEPA